MVHHNKFFIAMLNVNAAHSEASRKQFLNIGLTEGQPKILYYLLDWDGSIQKELASLCGIKDSTMTSLATKLEAEGKIRREKVQVSGGKRAYRIYLTPYGRSLAEKIVQIVDDLEDQCFKGFTTAEIKTVFNLLERIEDNLR